MTGDIAMNCPVCGYSLGFEPWQENSASDEICPSCGIQFGYDDATGGDVKARAAIYKLWRERWAAQGMPWFSKGRPCPKGWDPEGQLRQSSLGE